MLRKDNLRLIILIIIITCSEATGQYLLRVYHNVNKNPSFKRDPYFSFIPTPVLPFVTWSLYGICTFLLLQTYNYTTMGKAEVYWDALSALLVPLIGVIVFKNEIKLIGWLGIFLIIIGTILLIFDRKWHKALMPYARIYITN